MRLSKLLAAAIFPLGLGAHAIAGDEESGASIDFNRDVRPILADSCFRCHGPDEKKRKGGGKGGLRLDVREQAIIDLGGYAAIVPGAPDASELIRRVSTDDPDEVMPPRGERLSEAAIARLVEWIRQGAPYAGHWSYAPPRRPELPEIRDPAPATWPRNPVDRFILARLEREGLRPSPEADRSALIRRVTLDLTGLPPSIEDVDAFLADGAPDAYERLVEQLLASPAYGEHQARRWLDLARYADSAGYADDPAREIWAYRDWVIRAFNANLPFDRFTIEQIAGDLLPEPTSGQLIATAFHRNTLTNNEGGTNDEEFRNVAIVDRVNTTFAVWMGTTIDCAQCHDHKYDPITQGEFFRVFAILNQTADADRPDESPVHEIWTEVELERKAALAAQVATLEKTIAAPPEGFDPEAAKKELEELRKKRDGVRPRTTVPILRELEEAQRRTTRIQQRGNFLALGEEVEGGVPATFHPLPADRPADRLALASWLVDARNPLASRVVANRAWESAFGIGIVRTSEEFGSRGELPSHPELLDWLATELVAGGWDLKSLVRLLVTSATYRQSSRVTPELIERDPDNRLLARGPRFRMSAEMIRDQALFVSGLLSRRMYGPPVNPPQPTLGVNAAFGSGIDWKTSEGEDRYRRGIYTRWRRSNPYPSMSAFDAPNREVCTLQRSRTNTPLQALVTLNDPVYVEAAQAVARRIAAHAGDNAERARFGVRLCLAREPTEEELVPLSGLFEKARERYATAPEEARRMATDPLGPAPEGADIAELAAWTVVGNVLLNLDELFMKR